MCRMVENINKYSTCKFYFAGEDLNDLIKRIDGLVNYIFAKNGVFLVINTQSFVAFTTSDITYKYFNNDLIELPDNCIMIKFPKISINILKQVYDILSKYSHEVYCILYYDKLKKRFVLHVPEQVCSSASVKYDLHDSEYEKNSQRYVKCIDFHSHPRGLKSHSLTDLNDSMKTSCISCVVDLGGSFMKSTFEFKAPIPIKKMLIDVDDAEIVDFGSKEVAVLDYDGQRIRQNEPVRVNGNTKTLYGDFDDFDEDDFEEFSELEEQLWRKTC